MCPQATNTILAPITLSQVLKHHFVYYKACNANKHVFLKRQQCLCLLTSFEELLVSGMRQRAQQNSWMDPSESWGENKGSQGLEKQ